MLREFVGARTSSYQEDDNVHYVTRFVTKSFRGSRVYTWYRQSCWLSWLYPWAVCSAWPTRNNYISFDGRDFGPSHISSQAWSRSIGPDWLISDTLVKQKGRRLAESGPQICRGPATICGYLRRDLRGSKTYPVCSFIMARFVFQREFPLRFLQIVATMSSVGVRNFYG